MAISLVRVSTEITDLYSFPMSQILLVLQRLVDQVVSLYHNTKYILEYFKLSEFCIFRYRVNYFLLFIHVLYYMSTVNNITIYFSCDQRENRKDDHKLVHVNDKQRTCHQSINIKPGEVGIVSSD